MTVMTGLIIILLLATILIFAGNTVASHRRRREEARKSNEDFNTRMEAARTHLPSSTPAVPRSPLRYSPDHKPTTPARESNVLTSSRVNARSSRSSNYHEEAPPIPAVIWPSYYPDDSDRGSTRRSDSDSSDHSSSRNSCESSSNDSGGWSSSGSDSGWSSGGDSGGGGCGGGGD